MLKLIGILVLIVFVAICTGFNLSNTCTIWFFHNFEKIPVFAALLTSFLLGVIVTIPFAFIKKNKKAKKSKKESNKVEELKAQETSSDKEN